MASLVITKQYNITLDSGEEYKLDASSSVNNVGEATKRDFKIPTASEVTILLVGASVAAGQLTDLKYFVVHNTDTTNWVRIRLEDTSGHTADFRLEPGQAMDIFNENISVSETGAAFSSFSDIDTISAQADSSDVVISTFAGEAC